MNFNPEMKKPEPINPLKNEHLKEGIKPIIGGVYDRHNLDRDTEYFLDNFKREAEFVNFGAGEKNLKENRMLNSGKDTYVISPCDSKNKYSLSYLDCTGVVVVGLDKETGKNVSFLSHQNPESFLNDEEVRSKFKKDLLSDLDTMYSRCLPNTIDIVVFGGKKETDLPIPDDNFKIGFDNIDEFMKGPYDDYAKSLRFLNFVISQKVGFSPVAMIGPSDNFKTPYHGLSVYFDNENRRLYMLRPKQESENNEPFLASDVYNQVEKIEDSKKK